MLFAHVALFMICAAGAGKSLPDAPEIPIRCDPDLQERIDRAVRTGASTGLERWEQVGAIEKELGGVARGDPQILLRQVMYYYASHLNDERLAWAATTLPSHFNLSKMSIAQAAIPYINSGYEPVRREARRYLGYVENATGAAPPDYSYYESLLSRPVLEDEDALIAYLFERSPGTAMVMMSRLRLRQDREERRVCLWAEHNISDYLWKKQHRFEEARMDSLPSASHQVEAMAL